MSFLSEVKESSLRKLFVLGGQVVVAENATELVTILGSCVSVCLWDRMTMTGGMNHFLLPETVNDSKSLHGGIAATRKLVQQMVPKVSNIRNLEASVFGGANRFFKGDSFLNVGGQNVVAAKVVLEESGIRIARLDTGGEAGRKIYFNTKTGVVRVIRINYSVPDLS